MNARKLSAALRRDVDRPREARFAHRIEQSQRRARRRVLLELVVRLVQERVVILLRGQRPRGGLDDAVERIDADREVGSVHDGGAVPLHGRADTLELVEPTGRPDRERNAQLRQADRVVGNDAGNREIDGDVDRGEVRFGQRDAIGIVEFVETQADLEAVRGSQLLDQAAHASVADQRQPRGGLTGCLGVLAHCRCACRGFP